MSIFQKSVINKHLQNLDSNQVEWEEFFNKYKTEINTLQSKIDKTDQEIDQMVSELYGLIEEEIEIVANSTKGN